ncbi:MAG TPA: hypothetical protein VH601_16690 [Bryobacteraceae bacterium]|jgi:hypothetical protein
MRLNKLSETVQKHEATFTPGPWAVVADTDSGCLIGETEFWFIVAPESGIASDEQDDANARLIAAAPELYEALRFVEAITTEELSFAKVGTGAEVALRHANRKAREALAKAEGR